MSFLRSFLDKQGEMFHPGGKLEKLYPLYEALDTFAYTPGIKAEGNTHVRDGIDLKRTMISVIFALTPVILFALYNTGWQANNVLNGTIPEGWRGSILAMIGLGTDPTNLLHNFVHGALYFFPVFLVTQIAGGTCEVIFSIIRKHEVNEGFLVTGMLYPLILPPTIPLWQVAVGIIFGVVIGKEIFGGTGKNIFNPALTGRAFLFFAYPAQISGDAVWVAVDGYTGATALAKAATGGIAGIESAFSWNDAFLGFIPGSMGETSALLCIVGAGYLIFSGIGNWRIMLSMLIGMAGMAFVFNMIGSDTNPMFEVTPAWHFVLGGFAFACVFMATDPVSAAMTNTGRVVYGFLIGVLGVLIRVVNPAYPEGWMLAILFMNSMAPLIDYFVVEGNIKRRMARNV